MGLLTCESREIGGKTFQIRTLNVVNGRKVYHRIQPLLAIVGDEKNRGGLDPIFLAIMSGHTKEDDIDFLVKMFGETTTVDMNDGRTLSLKTPEVQNELFSGELEVMFEWLSACIEVNFAGVIAKMRSALSDFGDKAQGQQPKAE